MIMILHTLPIDKWFAGMVRELATVRNVQCVYDLRRLDDVMHCSPLHIYFALIIPISFQARLFILSLPCSSIPH